MVTPDELVEQTWEVIRSQEAPDARATWNRRQRRYSEMLMSNSPRALAELLGELAAVRSEKPLSFTEKRMFRQVWDLLVGEISASTGDSREVVEERLFLGELMAELLHLDELFFFRELAL